ncbi:MAG: hypothetical protein IT548_13925 [Alphaproteobacteria bacterium]|nr:hypothetical protein [Alphaproteobacteria bacterium]
MKKTARAAAALLAGCLAFHGPAGAAAAAKSTCVSGASETALQLRTVQTELMVGALSCGATPRYNEFVKANQPALMAGHTQLSKFFDKSRGGQRAMNAFITKLANDASIRSVQDIAKFCQESGWLYDAILSPKRGDLAGFVAPLWVAQRHGFTSCKPPATYVVLGPNGPQEAAAPAPAPVPAAAPKAAADAGPVPTPRPKPGAVASR